MLLNPWGYKMENHIFRSFGSYISSLTGNVEKEIFFYELRIALHGITGTRYVSIFKDDTKTNPIYDGFISIPLHKL
jgi:hypothetical protein